MQVLFQGEVKFLTGGISGGAKGAATDEPASPAGVGSSAGRTGEIPVPTVKVRMEEAGELYV